MIQTNKYKRDTCKTRISKTRNHNHNRFLYQMLFFLLLLIKNYCCCCCCLFSRAFYFFYLYDYNFYVPLINPYRHMAVRFCHDYCYRYRCCYCFSSCTNDFLGYASAEVMIMTKIVVVVVFVDNYFCSIRFFYIYILLFLPPYLLLIVYFSSSLKTLSLRSCGVFFLI